MAGQSGWPVVRVRAWLTRVSRCCRIFMDKALVWRLAARRSTPQSAQFYMERGRESPCKEPEKAFAPGLFAVWESSAAAGLSAYPRAGTRPLYTSLTIHSPNVPEALIRA